ncbi:MAG: nucleotidyltransferase family protein [Clostridiales bacterium]|nr:nucleotidyltransferase family protein [Clostridiales bacterium]
MPVLGVIAEYNPFHNGHLHHLSTSREAAGESFVIAVMSGQFVQRGEPAICDKYARTAMALKNGVDIVVELPACFATASAEHFASAAVKLMDCLGVVTHLSFGSESGDLKKLMDAASSILHAQTLPEYQEKIKESLEKGLPYFSACERALMYILRIDRDFISQPNHILAIEYLKALKRLNSSIIPLTAKRFPESFLPDGRSFLPASKIRRLILDKNYPAVAQAMPESAFFSLLKALSANGAASLDGFSKAFRYLLLTKPDLDEIMDINEGLENRLTRCAAENPLISDALKAANTKRYPYSRLQRAALHLVLGMKRRDFEEFKKAGGPQYIRILGFKKNAAPLLRDIKEKAKLPIVLNLKNSSDLPEPGRSMLEQDLSSSDIYYLSCKSGKSVMKGQERRKPIVII